MSHSFQAVGWNPNKVRYDATIGAGLGVYLALFVGGAFVFFPDITVETALIRALGSAAFLLLHVILSIGPLARLDRRFLPLLYNRRHLGVTMSLVALAHGIFSLVQFHALGDRHPLVSVLTGSRDLTSVDGFPFQPLGLGALAIILLMASTSHDFWLRFLTAPVWKSLHMGVYVAYALVVFHVALGALQSETSPVLAGILLAGVLWVAGVHAAAALRESGTDRDRAGEARDGFVDVCAVADIPDTRARVVCLAGERVAVFKYGDKVSAISNVCQHQNGPLGEGRIVNGCVVCPWHGYEYRPESGQSPPPFTERVPTFPIRVEGGRVLVKPTPLPAGTWVEPANIGEAQHAAR